MSLSRRFPQVLLATEKAGCAGQCVKGPVLTLVRSAWSGQPLPLIPHWLPALPAVGTGLPGQLRQENLPGQDLSLPPNPCHPRTQALLLESGRDEGKREDQAQVGLTML